MPHCATTCPYCGVGCGVDAELAPADSDERAIRVTGDANHPANAGRLCVKGTALAETLSVEGRLLHPLLHGKRLDWPAALDTVAERLRSTRAQYGPGSVAFYLSGQLLTEDYYVANKLMKGFLGSANVDTNSRLCMASAVAAYNRAFGEDLVPCSYQDLETCNLLVMVGSNAAWTHPVLYQRIVASKQANPGKRVVVIDTRRTATCDAADLHLQIAPGSDSALFGGLLKYLADTGALDPAYIAAHTEGFDDALAASSALDAEAVSARTGLPTGALATFYAWFAQTADTVTFYSQGINQSATGTDNCNAIINCHLATGRLGRPGAGPFSITGQPNAMGGREVGGLANQLAAHRGFSDTDIDCVQRFWRAPDMAREPGLKAVDLFRAVDKGEVRFLWIMATNPAVSLPDTNAVVRAIKRCPFVVVSDCTGNTDTAALADLLLPAQSWGEKSGTVTNSERVISRQRRLVNAPGEAKPDWWMVAEVGKRLGFEDAFDYTGPAAIFREHAALSGFENNGQRCFDISALQTIGDNDYDQFAPQRWPLPAGETARRVEPLSDGRFPTPNGRARFVAVKAVAPVIDERLVVNTGRLRDQWHTMTRTGTVPRLSRHRDFFAISVNPLDAATRGLTGDHLAVLANDLGRATGPLLPDPDLPRGQCFVPIHWSGQFAANGRVNDLVAALTDPFSGQPQAKFSLATLSAQDAACWGLVFSRAPLALQDVDYWSHIAVEGGFVTLIADARSPAALSGQLQAAAATEAAWANYEDPAANDLRMIAQRDGVTTAAVFLAPSRAALPERSWMATLGGSTVSPQHLLAGVNPAQEDRGAIVCSCWEVGRKQICAAIDQGATDLESLGLALRCGTQCGSCVPELKQLLRAIHRDHAA